MNLDAVGLSLVTVAVPIGWENEWSPIWLGRTLGWGPYDQTWEYRNATEIQKAREVRATANQHKQ